MFVKVGTILRPGIDANDLSTIIKADFDNDSQDKPPAAEEIGDDKDGEKTGDAKGQQQQEEAQPPKVYDYLDDQKLFDALFELADTWCVKIDEIEYQEFFEILSNKMKYDRQGDNSAYDVLM